MTRQDTDTPGEQAGEQRDLPSVYSLAGSDTHGELVDRSGLSPVDLVQIDEVMAALVHLRAAEKRLAEASLRYMELGETDMRALHLLIVSENAGSLATPGVMAESLGISSASTTKLIDRLERAGHVRRGRHPTDRRAIVVTIEPTTRAAALRTVGAQQARRVHVVRRLDPQERETVTRFLEDMAAEISIEGIDWAEHPAHVADAEGAADSGGTAGPTGAAGS